MSDMVMINTYVFKPPVRRTMETFKLLDLNFTVDNFTVGISP